MFFEMFLRVFSDCLIIFGLLGCCPTLLPYSFSLTVAALIFGLCAGLSYLLHDNGRRTAGQLCTVLPLLSLLLASGSREMIILLVPLLYTMYLCFDGMMNPEYFSYSQFFKRTLILVTIAWCVINIALYIEDPKGLRENLIHTDVIFQYTLAYFLCGVILQRQLRLGSGRRRGEWGQIVGVLGTVGAASAGFLIAEPLLRQSAIEAARQIVNFILLPFTLLLEYLLIWIEKMKQMQESKEYQEAWENSDYVAPGTYTDFQEYMSEVLKDAPEQNDHLWIMAFAAVAVMILLGFMIYAYTKLRPHRDDPLIVTPMKERARERGFSRLTNQGKVRQTYRDFLLICKQKGFVLKKHYTTADILQKVSTSETEDAARRLREVYLHARYNEEGEVTRAQVDAAREALKTIKKA